MIDVVTPDDGVTRSNGQTTDAVTSATMPVDQSVHQAIKRIGIAVVEHNGQFLVGIRGPNGPLPGYAEFPGGKCEQGESPDACAVRECLEETGLQVDVIRLLMRREFNYPHATVDLHFFLCRPTNPLGVREDQNGFRWITTARLSEFKFPDANEPLIERLLSKHGIPVV